MMVWYFSAFKSDKILKVAAMSIFPSKSSFISFGQYRMCAKSSLGLLRFYIYELQGQLDKVVEMTRWINYTMSNKYYIYDIRLLMEV